MLQNKWLERGLGILLACVIAAIYIHWRGPARVEIGFERGKMPACNSAPVRHLIVKSFENSTEAKQDGLKLFKVGDVQDLDNGTATASFDPKADNRRCTAVVFTNTGKDDFEFRISWINASKTEIWLESE